MLIINMLLAFPFPSIQISSGQKKNGIEYEKKRNATRKKMSGTKSSTKFIPPKVELKKNIMFCPSFSSTNIYMNTKTQMSNELPFSSGVQIIGYFFEEWLFSSTLHLNNLIIGHDDDLTKMDILFFTHTHTYTQNNPLFDETSFKVDFLRRLRFYFSNFKTTKCNSIDECEHEHEQFMRVYFKSRLLNEICFN